MTCAQKQLMIFIGNKDVGNGNEGESDRLLIAQLSPVCYKVPYIYFLKETHLLMKLILF